MPRADRTGAEDGAHRLQHRLYAIDRAAVTTGDDRKRAIDRPLHAAGDRRIEETKPRRDERLSDFPSSNRIGGAHLYDDCIGAKMLAYGVQHFTHDRAVRQHRDDNLCTIDSGHEGRSDLPSGVTSEDLAHWFSRIETDDFKARTDKTGAHGTSHVAKSNDRDLRWRLDH